MTVAHCYWGLFGGDNRLANLNFVEGIALMMYLYRRLESTHQCATFLCQHVIQFSDVTSGASVRNRTQP